MTFRKCAHPGCEREGTFPAPRSTKNIYDRQYFCEEHIKEFNKKWDGLKGMTDEDILSMQTKATWERPTSPFGIHSESNKAATFQFQSSDDLYAFFKQRQKREFLDSLKYSGVQQEKPSDLPPDVKQACAIMNIELPITEDKLRKTYLKLLKQHHPDKNAGNKNAEEMMKQVNIANEIIKQFSGF